MTEHLVCTACLTCLVNDDWTADHWADGELSGALAMAETLGWVTFDGTEDRGAYRCAVCRGYHYGPAEIVTTAAG